MLPESGVSSTYSLEDPHDGVCLQFSLNHENNLCALSFAPVGGVSYLNFSFEGGATGTGEWAEIGLPANKQVLLPIEVARQVWRLLTIYSPEERTWRRSA